MPLNQGSADNGGITKLNQKLVTSDILTRIETITTRVERFTIHAHWPVKKRNINTAFDLAETSLD